MGKWFKSILVGLFLTGAVFSQEGPYLQVNVEGLDGTLVGEEYPTVCGVGVPFANPLDFTGDTAFSIQVQMVGTSPATGSVQAALYVKEGKDYTFCEDPDSYTNLTSGSWVEVSVPVASLLLVTPDSVMEVGIKFTTTEGAVFTGNFRIDDVILKSESGNVVIQQFTEGPSEWDEVQVGSTKGTVIKNIFVPGVTSEPTGKNLLVTLAGLDGAGVLDVDEIETWPNLGGVGVQYGSDGTTDFTGATRISVQLKATAGTIPEGSALQGRIYLKTGNWGWATTELYTNMKMDKWVTINVPIENFIGDTVVDMTKVNEIGLQFQTYEMTYTGQILVDDIVVKKAGGNDTLFNFELCAEGWTEVQVTASEVYEKGKIVTGVEVPGCVEVGSGGAMVTSFIGLSGEETEITTDSSAWHSQCGLEITDLSPPWDFTDLKKVSMVVMPSVAILPGSALQARLFVKAGGNWTYSSSPNYMDLKGLEWTLIETNINMFTPKIEALDSIRAIGIQFFTQDLQYNGDIYMDNLKLDTSIIYSFESEMEVLDWAEANMGQIMQPDGVLQGDPKWAETVSIRVGWKPSHASMLQKNNFSIRQLKNGSLNCNFALQSEQPVTLSILDIAGRSVFQHSIRAKAGTTSIALNGIQSKLSRGMYTVSLKTRDGVKTERLVILK